MIARSCVFSGTNGAVRCVLGAERTRRVILTRTAYRRGFIRRRPNFRPGTTCRAGIRGATCRAGIRGTTCHASSRRQAGIRSRLRIEFPWWRRQLRPTRARRTHLLTSGLILGRPLRRKPRRWTIRTLRDRLHRLVQLLRRALAAVRLVESRA
ncbi:hypothetical protein ACQP2U_04535 [Nocardia sp. CA-084685]|uniref:hypothetical protein n=1 Tax=Nocardia sp. CA-084685 TaxID=3239970 RepID=UPI003D98E70F